MSEIRALLERYLRGGRYAIVCELTNSRTGLRKIMLAHSFGEEIDGRETLWFPLLDAEDEELAREASKRAE
jgi:hypothetical protein